MSGYFPPMRDSPEERPRDNLYLFQDEQDDEHAAMYDNHSSPSTLRLPSPANYNERSPERVEERFEDRLPKVPELDRRTSDFGSAPPQNPRGPDWAHFGEVVYEQQGEMDDLWRERHAAERRSETAQRAELIHRAYQEMGLLQQQVASLEKAQQTAMREIEEVARRREFQFPESPAPMRQFSPPNVSPFAGPIPVSEPASPGIRSPQRYVMAPPSSPVAAYAPLVHHSPAPMEREGAEHREMGFGASPAAYGYSYTMSPPRYNTSAAARPEGFGNGFATPATQSRNPFPPIHAPQPERRWRLWET
jgi:hypothetical protein